MVKNKVFEVYIPEHKMLRENSFIKIIKEEFRFPSYFGGNLDALLDCMTDLEWIDYNCIRLEIINVKNKKKSSFDYSDILESINSYWKNKSISEVDQSKRFELIYR